MIQHLCSLEHEAIRFDCGLDLQLVTFFFKFITMKARNQNKITQINNFTMRFLMFPVDPFQLLVSREIQSLYENLFKIIKIKGL